MTSDIQSDMGIRPSLLYLSSNRKECRGSYHKYIIVIGASTCTFTLFLITADNTRGFLGNYSLHEIMFSLTGGSFVEIWSFSKIMK